MHDRFNTMLTVLTVTMYMMGGIPAKAEITEHSDSCGLPMSDAKIVDAKEGIKRIGFYSDSYKLLETKKVKSILFPIEAYEVLLHKGFAYWRSDLTEDCPLLANRDVTVKKNVIEPMSGSEKAPPTNHKRRKSKTDPTDFTAPSDEMSINSLAQLQQGDESKTTEQAANGVADIFTDDAFVANSQAIKDFVRQFKQAQRSKIRLSERTFKRISSLARDVRRTDISLESDIRMILATQRDTSSKAPTASGMAKKAPVNFSERGIASIGYSAQISAPSSRMTIEHPVPIAGASGKLGSIRSEYLVHQKNISEITKAISTDSFTDRKDLNSAEIMLQKLDADSAAKEVALKRMIETNVIEQDTLSALTSSLSRSVRNEVEARFLALMMGRTEGVGVLDAEAGAAFAKRTKTYHNARAIRRLDAKSDPVVSAIAEKSILNALSNTEGFEFWGDRDEPEVSAKVTDEQSFGQVRIPRAIRVQAGIALPEVVFLDPASMTSLVNLRVRRSPHSDGTIIDKLDKSQSVIALGRSYSSEWTLVSLPGDPLRLGIGYVATRYLAKGPKIKHIEETADSYTPAVECKAVRVSIKREWDVVTYCKSHGENWKRT